MSLGAGVGDILACASLAYKIYQELSEMNGVSEEYQALTSKLLIVHKLLLQVEKLRASNQLAQSTLNAIRFLTSRMGEAIGEFSTKLEKDSRASQAGEYGIALKNIFSKGKSSLAMTYEVVSMVERRITHTSPSSDDKSRYNASYTPRWIDERSGFPNVRLSAIITRRETCCARPNFEKVPSPTTFFRPGRVFTVAIRGILTATGDEDIDYTHLPLEWTPLDSILDPSGREKERIFRQKRNYEAVIKLPLAAMFQYGDVQKNGQVQCHLCPSDVQFPKDFWVDRHFRMYHHETFRRLDDVSSLDERSDYICPNEISTSRPILSEPEVEELTANEYKLPTWGMDAWVGAITLRRFVVVQQGTKSCLCLGIHTYSGRGCSDQPDQELFAILHSLKYVPDPLPEETRMGIQPLRLKPEHPSTVLPSTARIHFGRVYEIKHDVELKNIGLIHSSSMNILSSQFESHCPIDTPNGLGASQDKDQAGTSADDTVHRPVSGFRNEL
ncbi:hypothetical protein AnigIFM63604_008808 [Aspergillus niger]|uniref:DUF6590 domain-containing protein n=1 Tax=Aspergillus niger TaxID=5061 RepID=A0A9W6A5K3_ASPNG|nr:hypothetical protein AnigIFM63604_008808 [Aspergillus niger]